MTGGSDHRTPRVMYALRRVYVIATSYAVPRATHATGRACPFPLSHLSNDMRGSQVPKPLLRGESAVLEEGDAFAFPMGFPGNVRISAPVETKQQ